MKLDNATRVRLTEFLKSISVKSPSDFKLVKEVIETILQEQETDIQKALSTLEKANPEVTQNNLASVWVLGYCFFKGIGVVHDYTKAFKWFEAAANLGFAAAQNNLGNCYFEGRGVYKNYKKAFEFYQLAANQGHADAQYNLGMTYEYGKGVDKDLKKAYELYQQAVKQGNSDAKIRLTSLIEEHPTVALLVEHSMKISALEKTLEQSRLEQHRDAEDYKRNLTKLAASHPDTLHKIVQSGDITFLEILFGDLNQRVSSVTTPKISDIKESFDTAIKKQDASNTLGSSISKIEFDLRGMSFIHVATHFLNQQDILSKRGAIFSLEQLEQNINTYLSQPSIESQRFLRQLHSDVSVLLDLWKQGKLNNKTAVDQLDQQSLGKLKKVLWPGNTTDLVEECSNQLLNKRTQEAVQKIKQDDFKTWVESKNTPELSLPYTQFIAELIWHWSKQAIMEGNLLSNAIHDNQENIIYQRLKSNQLPKDLFEYIIQQVKNRLLQLSDSSSKPSEADPLSGLKTIFEDTVWSIMEDKKKKGENILFQNPKKIAEEAIELILKQWQEQRLANEIEKSLKQVVRQIPKDPLMKGDFHSQISKESVKDLILQYKRSKTVDIKGDKEKFEALNHSVSLYLEELLTDLINKEQVSEAQKDQICASFIIIWKKQQLNSDEQNYLNDQLLGHWKSLLLKMQYNFDPMARLSYLEQELKRLEKTRANTETNDSKTNKDNNNNKSKSASTSEQANANTPNLLFTGPKAIVNLAVSAGVVQPNSVEGQPVSLSIN
jgi:TPR repeat protein